MTELSNAVTVLIARMESHPEDFEVGHKFAGVADLLYGVLGLNEEKKYAYWFLTDADKEALIEAWKKYHRTRMEKEVMEKIFDDGTEEREREMERLKMRQQMYQAQQKALMAQNSYPYTTTQIGAGQIGPAQNAVLQGGNYNAGLLGSAGTALKGFFG